jgi:hypothetical protein
VWYIRSVGVVNRLYVSKDPIESGRGNVSRDECVVHPAHISDEQA